MSVKKNIKKAKSLKKTIAKKTKAVKKTVAKKFIYIVKISALKG